MYITRVSNFCGCKYQGEFILLFPNIKVTTVCKSKINDYYQDNSSLKMRIPVKVTE